jgi:hypothetical protein
MAIDWRVRLTSLNANHVTKAGVFADSSAMRKRASILGLVLALGAGYLVYKAQLTQGPLGETPPQQRIDVTGVQNDLLGIAQAERIFLASNGSYATLDQLQQDGSLTFSPSNHRGYRFATDLRDGHFLITASPVDPAKQGWPVLTIDETLQISQR